MCQYLCSCSFFFIIWRAVEYAGVEESPSGGKHLKNYFLFKHVLPHFCIFYFQKTFVEEKLSNNYLQRNLVQVSKSSKTGNPWWCTSEGLGISI